MPRRAGDELFEVLGDELRTVIGDDAWAFVGVFLAGSLDDGFDHEMSGLAAQRRVAPVQRSSSGAEPGSGPEHGTRLTGQRAVK